MLIEGTGGGGDDGGNGDGAGMIVGRSGNGSVEASGGGGTVGS